jgi:hypothetical protein
MQQTGDLRLAIALDSGAGITGDLNKKTPAASASSAAGGSVNGSGRMNRGGGESSSNGDAEQNRLQNQLVSQMTSQKDFETPPETTITRSRWLAGGTGRRCWCASRRTLTSKRTPSPTTLEPSAS